MIKTPGPNGSGAFHTSFSGFLFDIVQSAFRRDPAEDHDIRNGVSAQAVAAVNSAGHLARREQSGNRLAFGGAILMA